MSNIYFICGHLDITPEEFEAHYVPLLLLAVADPDSKFVVGDANGVDSSTQAWLELQRVEKHRVTVYHMFDNPRCHHGDFPTVGGYTSDKARDEAMTVASTHDIAWVRPGREKSGTAKNLKRRNQKP